MSRKGSRIGRLVVIWACGCGGILHAADRTWNSGASVQWTNAATWVEGAVPTADDSVSLNVAGSITIASGVDAVAGTVAFSNAVGTSQYLFISDGGSLKANGAVTDPGAGSAFIRISNTASNKAGSVLSASSLAAQEISLVANSTGPQYLTTGYDMNLSSWLSVNNGSVNYSHIVRQTNGTISIANGGSSYSLVLMDSDKKPSAGTFGRYILDGGTLKAERIGVACNNGNNNGVNRYAGTGIFEFNNGTVQPRTSGATVSFHNGSAFEDYNGSGTRDTQFNTSKPTTVELAQTGTHTFYADGGGCKIFISPSAQVVDKAGQAGTLLKTGAGDLTFTGGGLAATNAWTGDTTVTAGRVQVDYSQIAGAAGGLALNNAYSPASKLVLNGGGFDLTGRGNATNSVFGGLTLPVGTFGPLTLTLPSTAGLVVGQRALNAYLPTNAYIRRILGGTQIELNAMSTSTSAQTGQTVTFEAAGFTSEQTVSNVELQAAASTVSVNPAGAGTLLTFVNVSGPGGLTKSGAGALRLAGTISYAGTNIVSAGTLDFAGSGTVTLTNKIAGSGTFRQSGTGTTIIRAVTNSLNSFNGAVVVDAGTLQQGYGLSEQYRGFNSAASYTINGGATIVTARDAMNGGATYILNGGTLKISAAGGAQCLGPLFLNGGTLVTARGCGDPWNAFFMSGNVTVTGAAPSYIQADAGLYNGVHLTFNMPSDGSLRTFRVEDATGDAAADLTISANLLNSSHTSKLAGLVKTGAGALLLSGCTNSYGGATIVSNGALLVNGGLPNSAVTVAAGASFGATGMKASKVASLTLAEGARAVWSYDGAARAAGRIDVLGLLTLPAAATLDVSGAGFLYTGQVLFTAGAFAGATDLSAWTINGAPHGSSVVRVGNQVVLNTNRGTLVRIL